MVASEDGTGVFRGLQCGSKEGWELLARCHFLLGPSRKEPPQQQGGPAPLPLQVLPRLVSEGGGVVPSGGGTVGDPGTHALGISCGGALSERGGWGLLSPLVAAV